MTDETPLVDAWSSFNTADERSLDSLFELTPPLLQRLADLTSVRDGLHVTDVGCSGGDLLSEWCRMFPRLIGLGIDSDSRSITRATEHSRELGLGKRLEYAVGDAYDLSAWEGRADVVLCQALLCNVARPSEVVRQMARATRAGGTVAAIEPTQGTLFRLPDEKLDRYAHLAYDKLRRLIGERRDDDSTDGEFGRRTHQVEVSTRIVVTGRVPATAGA
jgi:ubiquinone/menaquinone biosynthesis C-methylase UbiE